MVSEVVFLTSFLDCSMLEYRNTINLCMLILYPVALQKSFISSNRFLMYSLVFFIYKIISSVNRASSFTSSLLIWILSSFCPLIRLSFLPSSPSLCPSLPAPFFSPFLLPSSPRPSFFLLFFPPSFPSFFLSFSVICWIRTFNNVLDKSGEIEYYLFFTDLKGKAFSFSLLRC